MSKENLGNQIYSDTASLGKVFSLIGAIISTIIFVGAIIGGIYILTKKSKKIKTSGTVILINGSAQGFCSQIGNNQYSCLITVSFSYQNNHYQKDISFSGDRNYYVGEIIDIYISGNPDNISLSGDIPKYMGWVLIGIAFFILILSWGNYWLSKRYKAYGALQGVNGIVDTIFRR